MADEKNKRKKPAAEKLRPKSGGEETSSEKEKAPAKKAAKKLPKRKHGEKPRQKADRKKPSQSRPGCDHGRGEFALRADRAARGAAHTAPRISSR